MRTGERVLAEGRVVDNASDRLAPRAGFVCFRYDRRFCDAVIIHF